MTKYEREVIIAEMIAELEEQKRFEEFYTSIPTLIKKHKTKESHMPLIYITSANRKHKQLKGNLETRCTFYHEKV